MQKIESFPVPTAFGQEISLKGLRFFGLLRHHGLALFMGLLLVFLSSLIMVGMPVLINAGVTLIESEQAFTLDLIWFKYTFTHVYQIIWTVIFFAVVGAFIRTSSRMVIFGIGRSIERYVRSRLFSEMSILDDRFYSQYSVGELMNHLTNDIINIRLVTGFAVLNIMNIFFVFFLTVPFLLKVDHLLALCALLPFPLVMLSTGSISKKMFQATADYQAQLGRMTTHVQENLLGAHVVRLFHQQEAESSRFQITNEETYRLGVRLARVRVLMMPVMRLVVGMSIVLVLYVGGYQVVAGKITLGQFVEVNARILQLAWPAMSVGFVMSIYSRGQASLTRVNNLFAYIPIIKDGEQEIGQLKRVEVRELTLKNGASLKESISFSLNPGELLGVVGVSGSFKSRFLKTLCRRLPVDAGKIFYNGSDINNLKLLSLYDQISIVSQESFLFHKSIKENITFAAFASPEEIDAVLKVTRLDEDLKSLPDGLETMVGERGITLSGGQRQRVALARALLTKKPLLILDDALSSVDAGTEEHIIKNLSGYLEKTMVIIATHRFAVLKDASEILVLDEGQLIARGTHEHLMNESVLYQELWGHHEQ